MVRFDAKALFEAIDKRRCARDMTWAKVAAEMGVSASATMVARIRTGGRLEVDGMLAMVRWLGVSVETFVRESNR